MGNADSKSVGADESCVASSPKRNTKGDNDDKSSMKASPSRQRRSRKESSTPQKQSRDDVDSSAKKKHKIRDEQINVNLAMADLMAYLQVVANNSNHLPLTRRDDPELDRMVTTLTSEEYARKSAAFVPADIRVIGATFTRYGRVWDLPTSDEYNASDGALEPGRSYGGACSNTLLKVVYDAANDAAGGAQTNSAADALFDDDEDDEDASHVFTKSVKSGYSLDYGGQNVVAVTWAEMLRQMKAEFKEIGYAQVPKVTTTRKIDLNKPFSLSPADFDPKRNKKRSLLIGCNYGKLTDCELKASHDDIRSMKDYIVNVHNFPEASEYMTVLMDDGEHKEPSFLNIIEAFKALSEESQPGDAVFVQFSGHGGRVLDSTSDGDAESYDEVVVPTDYQDSGLIRDTLMFKTLLAPMRFGVTVTVMIDCCDNGMVLELPYSWSTKADKKDSVAKLSMNDDFSFVRFLKVVKTLYESSTFTQLGKTVGSALGPLAAPIEKPSYDSSKNKSSSLDEGDDARMVDAIQRSGSTIFDALVQACSPHRTPAKRNGKQIEHEDEKKQDELTVGSETLFEKVMNCTLLGPQDEEDDEEDEDMDMYSDESTFKTRTYDDQSYGDTLATGESYGSITEEEEPRRRSSRRRGR